MTLWNKVFGGRVAKAIREITQWRRDRASWKAISEKLGVSTKVLLSFRRHVGFEEPFEEVTDEELIMFIDRLKDEGVG